MKHELRKWQKTALGLWKANGHRGIVEVVTGGGKTVFAEACIHHAIQNWSDLRVIIVVPTVSLADQWAVSLVEEAGFASSDVGVYTSKSVCPARFTVAVINTARSRMEQIVNSQHPTLLIVDECHRAGSAANAKSLIGDFVATLGLSATPERPYDDALQQEIVPRIGPIIYKYDLTEAYRDHVITPFELINVRIPFMAPEAKDYSKVSRQIGHRAKQLRSFSPAGLEGDARLKALLQKRAGITNRAMMRVPTAAKLIDTHRSARTIIFHESIGSIEAIQSLAQQRGHSVTAYHTKIAGNFRRENLRLFRRGVYDVLCSCRALDEGMNVPEVQVAIIAAATATRRQRIQRLGRVLRPAPNKERAVVYTLYVTKREERRLVEEVSQLGDTALVRWVRADTDHGSITD